MAIHKNPSASTWSFLKIQFPKGGNKTKVIGFLLASFACSTFCVGKVLEIPGEGR